MRQRQRLRVSETQFFCYQEEKEEEKVEKEEEEEKEEDVRDSY